MVVAGSESGTFLDSDSELQFDVRECEALLHTLREYHSRSRVSPSANATQVSTVDDFPGLIVAKNDRIIAAIGVVEEPDRTLSVTLPMFGSLSSKFSQKHALNLMIQRALKVAVERHLRGIHALISVDATDQPTENLSDWFSDAGLPVVARIAGMKCDCAAEIHSDRPPSDSQVTLDPVIPIHVAGDGSRQTDIPRIHLQYIHPEALLQSVEQTRQATDFTFLLAVRSLVQRTLEFSDDLPILCRPPVDDMVNMWKERQAMILLVQIGATPAGLVVLAFQSAAPEPPPSSRITVEYLGVCPAHRRQGLASFLLDHVKRNANSIARVLRQSESTNIRERQTIRVDQVLAFADIKNEAAMRLYTTQGFALQEKFDLLYRKIEHCV